MTLSLEQRQQSAQTEQTNQFENLNMQSTEQLLLSGGDTRLNLDKKTGLNKYGCSSHPIKTSNLAAFGSSTGSTISDRGFSASAALHERLLLQKNKFPETLLYQHELNRIRKEFAQLCDFSTHSSIDIIFAASGTDLHLICSQLIAKDQGPPLHIIMMEACETGSGVAPALRGQHFSDNAALGGKVRAFDLISGARSVEISSIKLRNVNGVKRTLESIDAEVNNLIQRARVNHQHVLLIMIDVSKTGLIAPSPAYIAMLRKQYAEHVDILIDACQFRISNTTLNAYLELGCIVALTGSKFLTGPVFSGILLIPPNLIPRLSQQKIPASLSDYSAQAEWPEHWEATYQLSNVANWGLLLRLEAALAELRAFRAIPESHIKTFIEKFASVIQNDLQSSPHFSIMSEFREEYRLNRIPLSPTLDKSSWDHIPTIYPFLLQHQPKQPLTREQTQLIYQQLQKPCQFFDSNNVKSATTTTCYQLGQPVLCGTQQGIDVSALRICASSRLIIEACEHGEKSSQQVMQRALNALEKTAYLIKQL